MSEIRANTVSDAAGTGPATLTKQSAAKAWAHVEMSPGSQSRATFNLSSFNDSGTGQFDLSFISAMSDQYYSMQLGSNGGAFIENISIMNTTKVGMQAYNYSSGVLTDLGINTIIIHGDLA